MNKPCGNCHKDHEGRTYCEMEASTDWKERALEPVVEHVRSQLAPTADWRGALKIGWENEWQYGQNFEGLVNMVERLRREGVEEGKDQRVDLANAIEFSKATWQAQGFEEGISTVRRIAEEMREEYGGEIDDETFDGDSLERKRLNNATLDDFLSRLPNDK